MVSLKDYITFEEQVSGFISSVLVDGEQIALESFLDKEKGLRPDVFLPDGSRQLDFPSKTAVECVYRLTFDSVARVQNRYSLIAGIHVVIVYQETTAPSFRYDGHIEVLAFDKLRSRVHGYSEPELKTRNWTEERKSRLNDAVYDFSRGNVTLFLGAGVSIDAKLPSWDALLERIVTYINASGASLSYDSISKDAGRSTLITARALRMVSAGAPFEDVVKKALYATHAQQSNLVDSLVSAIEQKGSRITGVITYNFDNVLENNLSKPFCSVTNENRINPGTFPIFHVHGFIPDSASMPSSKIVFSEEAYHEVYKHSYHWSNIEQLHALANSSCCFIGLSMIDPNLRRLLDIASERDKDVYHYAFLRRPEFKDPDTVDKMLFELHVKVIWFMKFTQLPKMVRGVFGC